MPGDGTSGGVQHFTSSLVRALGRLSDGSEEYIVIGPRHKGEWLYPLLGPNQRLVAGPAPGRLKGYATFPAPLRLPLTRLYRKIQAIADRPLFSPRVPQSNGFYESLGADIIHFPHQRFVDTGLPAVYNPHDLQYVHYPEFFTKQELAELDGLYRFACGRCTAVASESKAVKDDVSKTLGISPEKIQVILWGPPTELYGSVDDENLLHTRKKFGLTGSFLFYPAQTWPHKNHLRLLEAMALLKNRHGLVVRLVCTGSKNFFWPTIKTAIGSLGLSDQVSFLGFVSSDDLQALYKLARFVIFPSLFEGGGFPVLEAFRAGAPLACSDIPPLREYAGQAAFYLEPRSVDSIADAVMSLTADDRLRAGLREKGFQRVSTFSWRTTARTYRALYRKVAGRELDEEDLRCLTNNGRRQAPPAETARAL